MEDFILFNTLKNKFSERIEVRVNVFVIGLTDSLENFDRKKFRKLLNGYISMRSSVNKLQYSETK